jgi:NADH-quinone oxidoreductase subunit H
VSPFLEPWEAVAFVGAVLVVGVYAAEVLDRFVGLVVSGARIWWPTVLASPLHDASLLLIQRRTDTERPDAQAWALAPALLAGLAAVGIAVVPFDADLAAADIGSGFVLFAAAVAFVMVAVYLHGWSANSTFSLVGGYRFIAAALSFQIPFLLALLATALPAESLSVGEIVRAQEGLWNVVRQPLGLPLYLVVAAGVTFWGPLNFPDAADLGGGTTLEVSGPARLLWLVARAAMLVAVAVMGAAAFLGGWLGPILPGPLWMALKTLLLLFVLILARHLIVRVRLEHFVVVAWTVLIPLALIDVFVSGVLLL